MSDLEIVSHDIWRQVTKVIAQIKYNIKYIFFREYIWTIRLIAGAALKQYISIAIHILYLRWVIVTGDSGGGGSW